MLAYVLECMDSEQGHEFLQSIKEIPRMYPGGQILGRRKASAADELLRPGEAV